MCCVHRLTEMGKITQDEIAAIKLQFQQLDTDNSGDLSYRRA